MSWRPEGTLGVPVLRGALRHAVLPVCPGAQVCWYTSHVLSVCVEAYPQVGPHARPAEYVHVGMLHLQGQLAMPCTCVLGEGVCARLGGQHGSL